jgi:hypothetical protein
MTVRTIPTLLVLVCRCALCVCEVGAVVTCGILLGKQTKRGLGGVSAPRRGGIKQTTWALCDVVLTWATL